MQKEKTTQKLVGEDEDSLRCEENQNQTKPQAMQRQSLTTSHQQTNALPISQQRIPWKNSPLPIFFLRMASYGMESLFGQFGSAVPLLSPPDLLLIPNLLPRGSKVRNREGLDAVHVIMLIFLILLITTVLVTNLKHSIIQAATKKINSITRNPVQILRTNKRYIKLQQKIKYELRKQTNVCLNIVQK